MADQIFNVNSGFYNAVNDDRVYYAEDMNKPYNRLISDGVYPNTDGSASTDLKVQSASSGMDIQVLAGDGLFAGKWFENPSTIVITVPYNTASYARVDSVIVQVDTRQSGRIASIVYRTGTAQSGSPAPAINTIDDVMEYRLANIYVAKSARNINNDAITDLRGTSSCPWVSSLIQDKTAIKSSDIDEVISSIS